MGVKLGCAGWRARTLENAAVHVRWRGDATLRHEKHGSKIVFQRFSVKHVPFSRRSNPPDRIESGREVYAQVPRPKLVATSSSLTQVRSDSGYDLQDAQRASIMRRSMCGSLGNRTAPLFSGTVRSC